MAEIIITDVDNNTSVKLEMTDMEAKQADEKRDQSQDNVNDAKARLQRSRSYEKMQMALKKLKDDPLERNAATRARAYTMLGLEKDTIPRASIERRLSRVPAEFSRANFERRASRGRVLNLSTNLADRRLSLLDSRQRQEYSGTKKSGRGSSVSTTKDEQHETNEKNKEERHRTATVYSVNNAEEEEQPYGFCYYMLIIVTYALFLMTFPVSLLFCLKMIYHYERAVIFRLGHIREGGEPGIIMILPCVEHLTRIDMRTANFDVPPQEILSRDSVTVKVDAVVYYRIYNARMAVTNVENVHSSTHMLAQSILRNTCGTKALSEILADLEQISHIMMEQLDNATEHWGVTVERVEIKDVRLPIPLQRAMAAEAEASREAKAKVIAASGERQAAFVLKQAADNLRNAPQALQLRYLQTISAISSEKNSAIIFPLPMELMRSWTKN